MATTLCSIEEAYKTQLKDGPPEVRSTIEGWSFNRMLGFGDVRRERSAIAATNVTRWFTADVLLTTTQLQCDSHQFTLYGYGRSAKVLDFHNIVGVLLKPDLDELEAALSARWRFLSLRAKEGLRATLARMIESEAHQIICSSEEARSQLAVEGIVSAEHCERTLRALKRGMGRLYRPAALLLALSLIVSVMPIEFLLAHFVNRLNSTPQMVILVVALAAAAIAIVGERFVQKRVVSVFPKSHQKGGLDLLTSTGAIRRWRVSLAIVTLLSVFALPLTAVVLDSYRASHPVLDIPVARSVENGWQVFDGADLRRESNTPQGYVRALHMSGNILVRGDLERVRVVANLANIRVDGSLKDSEIKIEGNGAVVAKDVERSVISIIGNGSVTLSDVTRSTVTAKHITLRQAMQASLECQDIRVTGPDKLGNQVRRHPWK